MGKRGPLPKPPETAQGHRPHELVLLKGGAKKAPRPPSGLTPATRKAWHAYWASEVSSVAQEVALPAIRRLFELYDQRERAMELVRAALMVKGSMGQIRTNPAADYVLKLEPAILRLENELGLTPMAMTRLGIAVGEAQMTAAELNRIAQEVGGRSDDDDEDQALRARFEAAD